MKTLNFKFLILSLISFIVISSLCQLCSQWVIEDTLYNTEGHFKYISVADSATVWVAGSDFVTGERLIYRRSHSGNWERLSISGFLPNQTFTSLAAINSQTAFIGAGWGNAHLYRTTNAGLNWEVILTTGGNNGYFNDIRFSRINPSYGYAWSDPPAGNGTPLKIYKTSNYGANWILYETTINSSYVGASPSICVTDSNHAWFGLNKNQGGYDYGKILHTSNGGINFSVQSIPLSGSFVTSIEFNVNNILGYSTVLSQQNFLGKSTTGGTSWFNFNLNTTIILCERIISIPNSTVWYALTGNFDNNRILKSTNGGSNWFIMQTPPGQYHLPYMDAIPYSNKVYVYAVSLDGYVLRLEDTIDLLGIHSNGSQVPENFELKQNYPNPFNPNTKIKFAVPYLEGEERRMRLVIYDILGKEIKTLVNEKLFPGEYEVDFDGSDYSSGIYLYKLTTEGFIDVKKMVLQK